jgi:carnitine O-acetyltransferase
MSSKDGGWVMSFQQDNEAKADFNNVYIAPTPHAYIAMMANHGYEIGEQARPYCTAAADLLNEHNNSAWPVQMLDVGCSYGIGSAFVKYGCSFDEMVAFFASRAPEEYEPVCGAMRNWLNVTPPACDVRCVGVDSSKPAVRFAVDAGLLDGGIAQDFEQDDVLPSEEDRAWLRSCNLMISTGAIGYVTERTFEAILRDFGRDHPGECGPFVVVTILRMFDLLPVQKVFEKFGLQFGAVPDVRLPQRNFVDRKEKHQVVQLLRERGIETNGWEDDGKHFADLFIAAPADQFSMLLDRMTKQKLACSEKSDIPAYIQR